ncbi:hypothetical protein [Ottowia testudinis]|uniref:Uncharacterized protein n=1 Tax=Ottowia testudinis TaxID=2816950 RepID=A0A975CK47_9BURK|nr:hypothetical protein [Ottowia testudinis]QTD46541.1 hypothetical protein J1M35_06595 [Ottowia testudinis]
MTSSSLLMAGLLFCGAALALPSAENSDLVPPNSPFKELGFPDAGKFNPNDDAKAHAAAGAPAVHVAPAAMTYPPAIVIDTRASRPYALVAAPTLPCAPGYCPRPRPRRDRN